MLLSVTALYAAIPVEAYFEPHVPVTIKNSIFIHIYVIAGLHPPFGNLGLIGL
jgi:hypothetical protein